jgi:hypothetical protein
VALTAAIWIYSGCFAGITFWSSDSTLQLSNNSGLVILDTDLTVSNGTIESDPGTSIKGFPINFSGGTYSSASLDILLTALYNFNEFYGVLLDGNKSFDALSGSFSGGILVSNQNNLLNGQPVFLNDNAILLQDSNATLTIGIQNSLTTSIQLNGGTLFLKNNLQLANNCLFAASGLIECYGYAVTFGSNPITFPAGTIEWSNYPIVNLNSNVVLDGRWTFSGPAVLNGNGNTIDFSKGVIRVDGSGPLYINNATLIGLGTGKFEFGNNNPQIMFSNVEIQTNGNYTFTNCLTMTFQGVTLYLDDDFTLSCGHFEVINSLDVVGSATFNYDTDQQSIIWNNSTMTIWGDATFNYMPPVANRDLIYFTDETSVFGLNGGTLASSTTGMRLLGGSFQLNNDCYLTNYGAVAESEGIQLGDGIDPTNDCFITFITGANFNTLSGLFVYNNVY